MSGRKSLLKYTRLGDAEVLYGKVFRAQRVGRSIYGRLPSSWADTHFIVQEGDAPNTIVLKKVTVSRCE